MKRLLPVLALAGLLGCAVEEELPVVELLVGGSVPTASITWRDSGGVHHQSGAELPWRVRFEAEHGTDVMVLARSMDLEASLWIVVQEDGREVRNVPGCLCDGVSVTVQAAGNVGEWAF
jgi:hypothetical protein